MTPFPTAACGERVAARNGVPPHAILALASYAVRQGAFRDRKARGWRPGSACVVFLNLKREWRHEYTSCGCAAENYYLIATKRPRRGFCSCIRAFCGGHVALMTPDFCGSAHSFAWARLLAIEHDCQTCTFIVQPSSLLLCSWRIKPAVACSGHTVSSLTATVASTLHSVL